MTDVAGTIQLARATMTNIRQNIVIALGLKLVFLVTTILGITGLWIAILADTGATVLVTLNALRLLFFRPDKRGVAVGRFGPETSRAGGTDRGPEGVASREAQDMV